VALLDADGKPVPFQSRCHATWTTDGGDGARWLLLDFQPRDGRTHRLVFGPDAGAPQAPALPNLVSDAGDAWAVDAGILKTSCPKTQFDPWTALTVSGQKCLDAAKPRGLLLTHEKRGTFLALNDREARVELEENGPWRATIKAAGWYVNEAGERFGRFIARLHFYRNQPDVRLEHTFIFTGETLKDRLTDLAVVVPLVARDPQRAGSCALAGEERSDMSDMYGFERPLHWSVVSDTRDGYLLEWRLRDLRSGVIHARGEKNAGWLLVSSDSAGVCLALRDAWEQSPFELEAEDHTARLHLWPRHGRPMDLSFDGMWPHLSEETKQEKVREKLGGQKDPEGKLKWCRSVNRSGIAKTHDIWMMFRRDNIYTTRDRARNVEHPVLAVADPQWACATEALLQGAYPYDPRNFRDEEAYLATVLDLRLAEREQGRIYGFFDFGGYHQLPFARGRNLDGGIWHRARPKAHYGWSTYAPAMYHRTGDRRYLRYAQDYTHYSADRAFCYHDNPATGDFEGGEYHYDNSEIGWLGGPEWASNLQGKEDAVYLYWMTGERRMLDAVLMWAEMTERYEAGRISRDPKGGWFKGLEKDGPYGNLRRNLGALLQRWTALYVATWDPRWKARADRIAETFRAVDFSRDTMEDYRGYLQYHTSWALEGLYWYHQVTGDARIREVLLEMCNQAMRRGLGFAKGGAESGSLNFYSFGYLLSGDASFLRVGRQIVLQSLHPWVGPQSLDTSGKWTVQTLPRFLGAFMKASPEFLAANLPTHERGLMVCVPQECRIYFLETRDGPVRVDFASRWGGRYVLYGPDGAACATVEPDYAKSLRSRIELPPDGKTGVYRLVCEEVSKTSPYGGRRSEYPPRHYVIAHSFAKVVYDMPTPAQSWRPICRSFVFQQKEGDAPAELVFSRPLGELVSRRPAWIEGLTGETVADLGGVWTFYGATRVKLPARKDDTLLRFRNGMVAGNLHTIYGGGEGGALSAAGCAPWFAATAEDFFLPAP
jgi:hypothetical protein